MNYNNVTVTGDLTGGHGVKGYLQVVFPHPSSQLSGDFHCEVNAFTKTGHILVLTAAAFVDNAVPTIQDLLSRVNSLEKEKNDQIKQLTEENLLQQQVIDQMNVTIWNLQASSQDKQQTLTQNITNLQQTLTHDITNLQQTLTHAINSLTQTTLAHNITSITHDITSLQQSVTDNKNTQQNLLSKLHHTQTGGFDCASGGVTSHGSLTRYYDYSVNYTQAYDTIPTLHFSVTTAEGKDN